MKTIMGSKTLGKRCVWMIGAILTLTLMLCSTQISFAKNTPIPPVDQSGTGSTGGGGGGTETGVIDGGGGATGPIERVAKIPTRRSKSPTSTLYSPDDNGGSYGVTFFEWSFFGYYKVVINLFYLSVSSSSFEQTSYSSGTQYE